MQGNKKAVLVTVELEIRVIVDEVTDPDVDYKEFNEAVHLRMTKRMKEEGGTFIGEGISDYNDDLENPYDSEFDA